MTSRSLHLAGTRAELIFIWWTFTNSHQMVSLRNLLGTLCIVDQASTVVSVPLPSLFPPCCCFLGPQPFPAPPGICWMTQNVRNSPGTRHPRPCMCYSHFLEHKDTKRGGRDICLRVLIWEAVVEIPALVPLVSMLGQQGHYSPLAITPLAPLSIPNFSTLNYVSFGLLMSMDKPLRFMCGT